MGKHLTAKQALIFSKCPRMYYHEHIKKEDPRYSRSDIMDTMANNARLAFLKNEKRFLSEMEKEADIELCYKTIFDMSVATAISRSSKWITDIDHGEIEAFLGHEMDTLISERMSRSERYMGHYGLEGAELANAVAYPPENIDRRVVDFKHKISNSVSIVNVQDDVAIPIQFSSDLPPVSGIPKSDKVMAKFNALLASECFEKKVPLSSIFYIKINEARSIPVPDTNKDDIKSYVKVVDEATAYEKNLGNGCKKCPYMDVCNNDD